jgi:hypothetical protein
MGEVAKELTQSSPAVTAGAMIAAYVALTGHAPVSATSWMMPLAQWAVETANGAQMYGWNAGNITHVPGDGYDYNVRGLEFRVYRNLLAGCMDMLRWLQKHGALARADAGDLQGYVAALEAGCYVGCGWGGYPSYEAGIANYMKRFTGLVPVGYAQPMQAGTAIAFGIAIIGLGVGTALVLHEGPFRGRGGARENPVRRAMRIQSLLFSRNKYTPSSAKRWARSHGYKTGKVDVTDRFIRLRQLAPGRFKTLRTFTLGKGIRAVGAR